MNAATNDVAPTLPINGLSHVKGWTDIPLSDATIYGLLADTARCYPDRPAVVFREQGRVPRHERDAMAPILRGTRVGIAAAACDQEQVLLLRPVRRKERREGRGDDEEQDEERPEDRRRVAEEPPEGVTPQPAGRRLERDLVRLDLGDAHE